MSGILAGVGSNVVGVTIGTLSFYGGQCVSRSRDLVKKGEVFTKPEYSLKTSLMLATSFVVVDFFINFAGHYLDKNLGVSSFESQELSKKFFRPSLTGFFISLIVGVVSPFFLPNSLKFRVVNSLAFFSPFFTTFSIRLINAVTDHEPVRRLK